VKLTDDVKQRKQNIFKQYHTAKQKLTNKENLVRFLHRGKPEVADFVVAAGATIASVALVAAMFKRFEFDSSSSVETRAPLFSSFYID